jgi:peptidoglycan/LPS O-acetylase OafA/YrhL
MRSAQRSDQIGALTGVRGVAALWVAAFHGLNSLAPGVRLPSPLANLIQSGWLAVDLFFVLSGFVISYAHMNDFELVAIKNSWAFWKLRLARIYPAHATVALLWLPLIGAAVAAHGSLPASLAQNFNLRTFVYALTLTNGWGLPASQGWNLPSWSVGSEWFAYVTFPLIALGLRRLFTTRDALALAATTMSVTTFLAIVVNHGRQYMLPEAFTLVRVESEFLLGCCAYVLYCRTTQGSRATWFSWTGALGCILLACTGLHGLLDGLYIPSFFLLIFGLSVAPSYLSRILALPALVHLGKISYSIYLIHAWLIVLLRQAPVLGTTGTAHPWLIGALYFGLVIALGHLLYAKVEEPARTYLRRVWVDDRLRTPSVES